MPSSGFIVAPGMGQRIKLRQHACALLAASFEIVSAQIHWCDGRVSEGWGRDADLELAGMKAMAEAVERHAHTVLPATARWQTASSLPEVIAPESLIRYGPDVQWRQEQPWLPDEPRWWLPARCTVDDSIAWVLADCVCNPGAFEPAYRSCLLMHASSCGTASGASIADAALRATLELIERDAFMRHWFTQRPGRAVPEDSLPSWATRRLRTLAAGGCKAGVQYLDLGMHPTWLAWAQHHRLHFTSLGAASATDAESALAAALNELDTHALARIEGVPPQDIRAEQVASPADHAALYATRHSYRRADALLRSRAPLQFDEVAASFTTKAEHLYARLQTLGHSPRVVDLTLDEASNLLDGRPLHTVRAVAPGLIPMTFGHGQLPLGMMSGVDPRARFPHPFP